MPYPTPQPVRTPKNGVYGTGDSSIGIIDGYGQLPPLESLTPRQWKISHADDGAELWVYWEMPRGPSLKWCERVSRAFPAVTVTVQYLYENDLGAGLRVKILDISISTSSLRWHFLNLSALGKGLFKRSLR